MDIIKKLLRYEKDDSLIRDGIILFTATMIANAAGYIYHFGMGRFLGPADYGALGAILSLLYLLLVPFNVIQTTISKFVAKFKAENKLDSINYLLYRSLRKLLILGIILLIIFIAMSRLLSGFLKIDQLSIVIFLLVTPLTLLLPVNRGVFQGMQSFKKLGANIVVEALSKLVVGFVLVLLGFKLAGAVLGIVMSYLFSFGFSLFKLRKKYSRKYAEIEKSSIYKYSIPVLVTLLSLTAFYSIDVILVKHYFDGVSSGYYAAAALLGRIVFFATLAISMVMFPKVAEMDAKNKPNVHILKKAIIMVLIVSLAITIGYFMMPRLVVLMLFGSTYIGIADYIAPFAIIMSLFSLSYLLAMYNLSLNRIKFIYLLLVYNVLEVTGIILMHDSISQVIIILMIIMGLMFITLLLFTLIKNARTVNNNTGI